MFSAELLLSWQVGKIWEGGEIWRGKNLVERGGAW